MSLEKKTLFLLFFLIGSISSNYLRIFSTFSSNKSEIEYLGGACQVKKCGKIICATSPKGECSDEQCTCNKGYTSRDEDYPITCCYQQKKFYTAMFLELFLSFGIGHFYRGDTSLGILKMSVFLILTLSLIVLVYQSYKLRGRNTAFWVNTAKSACLLVCSCTFIGWQMTDVLIYGLDYYKDGNGVNLY